MKTAIQLITIIALGGYTLFLKQKEIPNLKYQVKLAENSAQAEVRKLVEQLVAANLTVRDANSLIGALEQKLETANATVEELSAELNKPEGPTVEEPIPEGLSDAEYRRLSAANQARYESVKLEIDGKIRDLRLRQSQGAEALSRAEAAAAAAASAVGSYRQGKKGIQKSQSQLETNSASAAAQAAEIRSAVRRLDLELNQQEDRLRKLDVEYQKASRSLDLKRR